MTKNVTSLITSMSINTADLSQYVIQPTLELLDAWSPAAEQWLLNNITKDTQINAINSSTGLGLFQISSAQHHDIWDNYLAFIPDLASKIRGLASQHHFIKNPDRELLTNLSYSAAIAWVIHSRVKQQTDPINQDWPNYAALSQ